MASSLEDRVDALLAETREDVRLSEAQLTKSRAARATSTAHLDKTKWDHQPKVRQITTPPPTPGSQYTTAATPAQSQAPVPSAPQSTVEHACGKRPSSIPTSSSSPPSSIIAQDTHKEGTLLHLVRTGGIFGAGGTLTFVPHYVLVSPKNGIAWYTSRAAYIQHPQQPLGQAAFFIEVWNSRGSRFKKAAVCWPLILPEDCSAANDPTKTYFAIDYYTPKGARAQLVLAASSPEERDAWVYTLTKYIDLYLAARPESEALQHLPRGAPMPLHRSGVLEGEAPGGNIL